MIFHHNSIISIIDKSILDCIVTDKVYFGYNHSRYTAKVNHVPVKPAKKISIE